MISVDEAISIVEKNVIPQEKSCTLSLSAAAGYVLFNNVLAPIDMPPFRQSAMDGYALNLHALNSYRIIEEVKAGDSHQPVLQKGEAARIFTGAPVPDSANAIVIQEHVKIQKSTLSLDQHPSLDDHIRPMGEQIKKGHLALKKGSVLTSAGLGYLTSLGITDVEVYPKPKITVIVTGNELARAGEPLSFGQIYESNALMLTQALQQAGYQNFKVAQVPDSLEATREILEEEITRCDLLLISGGISVGAYDFVGRALDEIKVKQLFYKVNQKPGKPLYFGKLGHTYVFALPGNPAAALTCFYIYVRRVLAKISGQVDFTPLKISAKVNSAITKKGGRAQFLKADFNGERVTILEGQNSSMLYTFAVANALVYIPAQKTEIEIDEAVEVILLPLN